MMTPGGEMVFRTFALVLVVACSGASGASDDDGMIDTSGGTKIVSVTVLDAVIAPGEPDHSPWDGPGTIPDSVWSAVTSAMDLPEPFEPVVAALGESALNQFDKPDPYGTAVLLSPTSPANGMTETLATTSDNQEDTYVPDWPTPASWSGVVLDNNLRIRVTLTDEDLLDDDPIGVVELNAADVQNALAANQVFHAKVDDQANGSILLIGISVQQTGTQQ